VLSLALKRVFMFKCNLSMLRLTPMLALLALPPALARVLAFHRRERPPKLLTPGAPAVVLAAFPVAWFFGFLYYTELPGLLAVAGTLAAAAQGRHWLAGLVRALRAGAGWSLTRRRDRSVPSAARSDRRMLSGCSTRMRSRSSCTSSTVARHPEGRSLGNCMILRRQRPSPRISSRPLKVFLQSCQI
jgi:hypothetical protein